MKGSGETKLLLILGLIVILGGGAMFGLNILQGKPDAPPPTPKPFAWTPETFDELTKGSPHIHDVPSPQLTMVEFADFQCPSCRRAFNTTLKKLKKEKPVRFYFRHMPLVQMHEHAMDAALAVEAADKQGKFWEMYDALFEGEKTELNDFYMEKCAKNIGLDMAKYKKDLNDGGSRARIDGDIKDAEKYHVSSTPTFIIKDDKGTIKQIVGGKDLEEYLKGHGITL